MPRPVPIELQRLRYRQGQKLRSRDFRDQLAIEAELRWWHNRALHNAFGVVEGLEVHALPDLAEGVRVCAGLAYDCFGRELLLTHDTIVPNPQPPPQAQQMTLLIAHPDAGRAAGPKVFWRVTAPTEVRDGVPLARRSFMPNGAPQGIASLRFRARPLARPRVASGQTIPGNTEWRDWSVGDRPIGLQVTIDTTTAGFTAVPCYFAWLQGSLVDLSSAELGRVSLLEVPATHVDAISAHGFTFRLYGTASGGGASLRTRAREKKLFVSWLAVEDLPHATPACGARGDNDGHA